MSKRVQLRRGTATQHNTFTGADGEVTVDTTNKTLRVHDGITVGGTALARTNQLPEIATITNVGLIQVGTQEEVDTGAKNDRAVTPATLRNTIPAQTKSALNATGGAPIYACRAWVNFNGTGTVAIRGSGNVSSITDNGVGDFTINFTTAIQDANYAIAGVTGNADVTANPAAASVRTQSGEITTTSCRVRTANHFINSSATAYDMPYNSVIIFR